MLYCKKMSTILNGSILSNLIFTNELKVFKCSKSGNFKNYFFSPNVSIKLYNPKVTWIDGNSISFSFQKYATIENNKIVSTDNINLLNLLKKINEALITTYTQYKENYGHESLDTTPCLFYEKNDYFYVKCSLPNRNGKYHITSETPFVKPTLNTTYTSATVDIRNIWETTNKVGFKLELKSCENPY